MNNINNVFDRVKAALSFVFPISRKVFTSNNTTLEPGMAQVIDSPGEKSLSILLTDGTILKLEASRTSILTQEALLRIIVDGLIKTRHLTPAFELETTDSSISVDSRKWDFVVIGSDMYLRTIAASGGVQLVMKVSRSDQYVTGVQFFGGAIGFNGAAPVAKAADPGTATGTDAAVINALVSHLRAVGLFS